MPKIENLGEEEKRKRLELVELFRLLLRKNDGLVTVALGNGSKFQGDSLGHAIMAIKAQAFDQMVGALNAYQLIEEEQKPPGKFA